MKRRKFISQGSLVAGGAFLSGEILLKASTPLYPKISEGEKTGLYGLFKNPGIEYHPFVRWWWNGNRIEKEEISRELRLLKEAGIGGVEINPIEFPHRIEGDDLGIPSLRWLSDEWIEMLEHTFSEAKKLGIICDLIVGSGWPFGSETLKPEERAEVVLLNVDHIDGPCLFEKNREDLLAAVDPKVTVPFPGRTFEIISLQLVPDPATGVEQALDISGKSNDDIISLNVPEGKHALYSLVRVKSFASVINGAPGAAGPILNHMDKNAVEKYLGHMSHTIENKTGPLSEHLRAFFTDSMELEGCNWTSDFEAEFKKRRGYDLMPYLPFIMFKVGRLGGVVDFNYGVKKSEEFEEETGRVRFDFELTKAELLYERFTLTYLDWCHANKVKSRAQAYGRGFFPLETSLGYDIPEGESWTTNWLKHKVGEEMPDDDYRRGRAYTMINKYVSSAAHLSGTRVVSCEEMTNTYLVFNTSLERLKNGSDQSIISGITHSVWHGFNYSPPGAPYPGWIQYGSYLNEQNNWWPYFKYLNIYKARISALLQNADMYSDIAILPANYDLWTNMGVQTDPFPERLNIEYTSLLWEAICKNGGSADYLSEIIINKCSITEGNLCYNAKRYSTIFLPGVRSISPEVLEKLLKFVTAGGKVICIDNYPDRSPGLLNHRERDRQVAAIVKKLQNHPNRFILLDRPLETDYISWYKEAMEQYSFPHYIKLARPDQYLMQVRYTGVDGSEIFFFSNSSINLEYNSPVRFRQNIVSNRNTWIWNPESGERHMISLDKGDTFKLRLGPAESLIIVFDKEKNGPTKIMLPAERKNPFTIKATWNLEFDHCRGKQYRPIVLNSLTDLSEVEEYRHFSGKIIYSTMLDIEGDLPAYLEIKGVHDIAELWLNDINCGVKWYGEKIFNIDSAIRPGTNKVKIMVSTLMGNYMKSLIENPVAQYWTNEKNKNQALTPIGLEGPIILFG